VDKVLPSTVGEALDRARALAATSGGRLTPVTAQTLLAHVTGQERAWLLAHREAALASEEAARVVALLERAAAGEPLPQLTGEQEFCGLPFYVTRKVLIPRPETEAVVDVVLDWAARCPRPALRIVDVGTGSGAISVTLAVRLPAASIWAVDVSWPAVQIARQNALRHRAGDRVQVVCGSLLDCLRGPLDVIAANLPYINAEELAALEVGRWEPRLALDGGADGLALIRGLLEQAPRRLAAGGLLVLEIGYDQGPRVVDLCRRAFPEAQVTLMPDLAELDRIVRVALP
jgi:release factor glutamine methyltransferase